MIADRQPAASSGQAVDSAFTLRKLASSREARSDTLNVTLFRGAGGGSCGWFIGPLTIREGRATLPYLAQSEERHAAVAVVRAVEAARSLGCPVCVIDPDDLWDGVWHT